MLKQKKYTPKSKQKCFLRRYKMDNAMQRKILRGKKILRRKISPKSFNPKSS